MVVRVTVGPPAIRTAFFDRESLVEQIWSALERGSVLLVAPRRFGKTSIMHNLREYPRLGYRVFYIDTEDMGEPADLITEMMSLVLRISSKRGVLDRVKVPSRWLSQHFQDYVEETEFLGFKFKLRERLQEEWKQGAKEFEKVLGILDEPLVFITDELSLMANRMLQRKGKDETNEFLFWFRALRISQASEGRARFVIGGSIGFDRILMNADATASLNDLHVIKVGPFDDESAQRFVKELLRSEGLEATDELVAKILEVIEVPIPFFIQILISALKSHKLDFRLAELNVQVVDEVYQSRVLGTESRTYFEHYKRRLSEYYSPEDTDAAKAMLKGVAIADTLSSDQLYELYLEGGGDPNKESFIRLLSDLENDFYVEHDTSTGNYRFATKVLRDWWLRFTYV